MRIPKGTDIRFDTSAEQVELHITAAITTRAQANDLIVVIKQASIMLEGEKRVRKPKVVVAA